MSAVSKSSQSVADDNTAEPALITAKEMSLHVPVIRSDAQRLLANPWRIVADFYTMRTQRSVSHLINNLSFTLEPGDRLGLIGGNGAGKSTLLRLLAGIYKPSSGTLEARGTVKGLFDISLGMLSEATGVENIYLRGLQMGLSLAKIRELIPEIMAFCELDADINKPLGTYSAGMKLRLAVAVSTMVTPDILLFDEWIGTGDARFAARVRARLMDLVHESRGLVLATHNKNLMKSICNRGMVLDQGRMVFIGPVDEALEIYAERSPKP